MDVQVHGKVGLLRRVVEELREKTWELDTNKRNNLVLYGVREEASPGNTEWAVREVSNTIYSWKKIFKLREGSFAALVSTATLGSHT